MGQISVTIAGRSFRMACDDGQEEHLETLARELDNRMAQMKQSFGEVGDQRLTTMTALIILDELNELKNADPESRKITDKAEQKARDAEVQIEHMTENFEKMASGLNTIAERIETLSATLNTRHVTPQSTSQNASSAA